MSEAPAKTDEIENKQNVNTAQQLDTIRDTYIQKGLADRTFAINRPEIYFQKDRANVGLLQTHPVSWYMDTDDLSLLNEDKTIRGRLTTYMHYIEVSIKGNGVPFVGDGGSLRHEDEKFSNIFGFNAAQFQDHHVSREVVASIEGKRLYPYFATDVKRDLICTRATAPSGKNSMFEIAFDKLRYTRHDTQSETGLSEFAEIFQIEIEYYNPSSNPEFAKQMGLDILTKPEVEIALAAATTELNSIATMSDIALTPSNISKGRFGYEELERQNLSLDSKIWFDTRGGYHLLESADVIALSDYNVA